MVGLVHFFPLYPLPLCTLLVQRIRLYRYCDKYSAAALLAPSPLWHPSSASLRPTMLHLLSSLPLFFLRSLSRGLWTHRVLHGDGGVAGGAQPAAEALEHALPALPRVLVAARGRRGQRARGAAAAIVVARAQGRRRGRRRHRAPRRRRRRRHPARGDKGRARRGGGRGGEGEKWRGNEGRLLSESPGLGALVHAAADAAAVDAAVSRWALWLVRRRRGGRKREGRETTTRPGR